MGKYFKVYAQCIVNSNPIREITEEQAIEEINKIIYKYLDNEIPESLYGKLVKESNFDNDIKTLEKAISNLVRRDWENNELIEDSSYMIVKTNKTPIRPNVCGIWHYSDEEIENEFNNVKSLNLGG